MTARKFSHGGDEYQEVSGNLLMKKMTYSFSEITTGQKMVGPVVINFSNCKVDVPVAGNLFKGNKVQFVNPESAPDLIPTPQKIKKSKPEKNKPQKKAPAPSKSKPNKELK